MSTHRAGSAVPQAPSSSGVWEQLITAWSTAWPYVLTGVAVGVVLVIGAFEIPHKEGTIADVMSRLVEHLGMGFIVAAIAVLFYEWGAHIKDAVRITSQAKEVADQLKENVAGVSRTVEGLQSQTTEALRITANVEEILAQLDEFTNPLLEHALRATLTRALRAPISQDIVEDLGRFVLSLKELEEAGDWARDGYISYLGALLHNATRNADPLCKLSTQLRVRDAHGVAAEYRVAVLHPAALTDIMLEQQMCRLPASGKYSVVSNAGSWRSDQLSKLHAASEKAVKEQGVEIRRIFVLVNRGPHRFRVNAKEVRHVLTTHFRSSEEWVGGSGFYQVKVLDAAAMEDLNTRIFEASEEICAKHFGVFEHPGGGHCLRVEVTSPDLADLRIAGLNPNSKELQNFESVWKALPPLTKVVLEEALMRWEKDHPEAE
jgi:hypothetical protein